MIRIILSHELMVEGVSKIHLSNHLGVSRLTIILWSQVIERYGSLDVFLERHMLRCFNGFAKLNQINGGRKSRDVFTTRKPSMTLMCTLRFLPFYQNIPLGVVIKSHTPFLSLMCIHCTLNLRCE